MTAPMSRTDGPNDGYGVAPVRTCTTMVVSACATNDGYDLPTVHITIGIWSCHYWAIPLTVGRVRAMVVMTAMVFTTRPDESLCAHTDCHALLRKPTLTPVSLSAALAFGFFTHVEPACEVLSLPRKEAPETEVRSVVST